MIPKLREDGISRMEMNTVEKLSGIKKNLTFYFELMLGLQRRCKKDFLYYFSPSFPSVNILHNLSIVMETRELTLVQYYKLN